VATDRSRTEVLAWYTLVGSLATALGALAAGMVTRGLRTTSNPPAAGYRAVVVLYAVIGVTLAALFAGLSRAAEATSSSEKKNARATVASLTASTDRGTSS
jgi:MFS family permease